MKKLIDKKTCLVCGKEIKPSKKYCSRACYYKGRSLIQNKTGIMMECEACGKSFYVRPSYVENRRFCSTPCWTRSEESKNIVSKTTKKGWLENPKIGENNGNWKGGITPKQKSRLTSKSWKKTRKIIIKRDNSTCQKCGIKTKRIHVHHKIPWRFGGTDSHDNLICLCHICHMREEVVAVNKIYQEAIDKYCNNFCNDRAEVATCEIKSCPLWHQRPWQKKTDDDE